MRRRATPAASPPPPSWRLSVLVLCCSCILGTIINYSKVYYAELNYSMLSYIIIYIYICIHVYRNLPYSRCVRSTVSKLYVQYQICRTHNILIIIGHRFGHRSGLDESSGRNSTTILHGIAFPFCLVFSEISIIKHN